MSHHDEEESASSRASEGGEQTPSTSSQADSTNGFSGEDAEPPLDPASPEEQLEAARREAADNYERFIRAKADIENILKRHQRELSDRARYDGEGLARDILQSIDDLERALAHAADGTGSAVSGGVELVLKGLVTALKNNGVERVEAAGKPFDPAEHEAVAMVETADAPPNTVMEVFRAGYKMRDRLLRAAMVSVSKAPTGQD
ncbi:MAG: nucleotide exchange factor GrpE [Candidatus Binatia bacterium]